MYVNPTLVIRIFVTPIILAGIQNVRTNEVSLCCLFGFSSPSTGAVSALVYNIERESKMSGLRRCHCTVYLVIYVFMLENVTMVSETHTTRLQSETTSTSWTQSDSVPTAHHVEARRWINVGFIFGFANGINIEFAMLFQRWNPAVIWLINIELIIYLSRALKRGRD